MNVPEIEVQIAELEQERDRSSFNWRLLRVLWEIALQLAKPDWSPAERERRTDA
jgi:hypothetical protein